jgi:phosphatidylglycerophosphate synthase
MGAALASPQQQYGEIVATLRGVQKSNRGAAGYARWVNRKLGRYMAAAAFKLGLTPNQVTVVSAVFTFTALALIAVVPSTVLLGVVVTLLLLVGFALDAADGQLARLRGGGSAVGEWLDHVIDCIKCTAINLVVLIAWFRYFDLASPALLLIPLAFTLQSATFFFTIILTEQLRRSVSGIKPSTQPKTDERAPILKSIVKLPTDYGVHCLAFLLLGFHTVFIWVYALLTLINIGSLGVALIQWYRELRALGR